MDEHSEIVRLPSSHSLPESQAYLQRHENFSLFFQLGDCGLQPFGYRFFNLVLIAISIERIESFSDGIQRNMPAWYRSGAKLGWHKLHEYAVAARFRIIRVVVIHARGRIFEDENWSPRRARRTRISATLYEFELVFENIQKISFVSCISAASTPSLTMRIREYQCCDWRHIE